MLHLEAYQISVTHSILIKASATEVLAALERMDGIEDRWMSMLLRLRAVPYRVLTPGASPSGHVFSLSSFLVLSRSENELVLGMIGRFWLARPIIFPVADVPSFIEFHEPGISKLAMSFTIESLANGRVRLLTTTRIFSPDPCTRRKVFLYWLTIRPGIEIMRYRLLWLVRKEAERCTDLHSDESTTAPDNRSDTSSSKASAADGDT